MKKSAASSTKRSGSQSDDRDESDENESSGSKRQNSKSNDHTAIISGLTAVISEGIGSSVESLKTKLADVIGESGESYLKDASKKISEATEKLIDWSKDNPVKTAAAAASLLAVSAFIYHTMKSSSSGQSKRSAKKA